MGSWTLVPVFGPGSSIICIGGAFSGYPMAAIKFLEALCRSCIAKRPIPRVPCCSAAQASSSTSWQVNLPVCHLLMRSLLKGFPLADLVSSSFGEVPWVPRKGKTLKHVRASPYIELLSPISWTFWHFPCSFPIPIGTPQTSARQALPLVSTPLDVFVGAASIFKRFRSPPDRVALSFAGAASAVCCVKRLRRPPLCIDGSRAQMTSSATSTA